MNSMRQLLHLLVIMTGLATLGGCSKSEIASPACAELEKTSDPVKKVELEKRCPRGGQFKPSPTRNW